MRNYISFYLLLLICVAALHAHASQEAQLRKYIRSRSSSSSNSRSSNNVEAFLASESLVTSSLPTGYSGSARTAQKETDKIVALPGQPEGVNFDQYGGYVTVDEKNGRELFYYFVESPYDASAKPLVLWLNGGPGCSSFGVGAMQELGPFRVNSDNKTLRRNQHAWNNVANVLFLESPAGVGFSYSNTTSDYDRSGDQRTAEDAYVFLINWLERFPEYKTRPFYISGESYAGHYVPQLAATILGHNIFFNRTIINLRGILVGNPYLDDYKNLKGKIDYLWSHGVVSDEVFANITMHCNFSSSDGKPCFDAMHAFDAGQIDGYNIYAPICIDTPNGKHYSSSYLPGYDPCSDYYVNAYLNDLAVQKALHARINTKWSDCANLHWKDAPESTVPTIEWLVEHELTVWLFSGDFDAVCPLPATRYSVKDLNLPVTKPWRPWTANMEVGGYVQQYKGGFVLVSVRELATWFLPSSLREH